MSQKHSTGTGDPDLLLSPDRSNSSSASDDSTTFPEDRFLSFDRRSERYPPRIVSFKVNDHPTKLINEDTYQNRKSRRLDPVESRLRYRPRQRDYNYGDDRSDSDSRLHIRRPKRRFHYRPSNRTDQPKLYALKAGWDDETLTKHEYSASPVPRSRAWPAVEVDVQNNAVYRRLLHQHIIQNLSTVRSYLVSECGLDSLTMANITKLEPFSGTEHTSGINFAWSETEQHVDLAQNCQYHWIHGQGKKMNIDNLKTLVTGLPQLNVEEKALAINLLDPKRKEFESNRTSGGYLEPSIDRADATRTTTGSMPPMWAIFCNIPYISIARSRTLSPAQPKFVRSQPITQMIYPLEKIRPTSGDRRALYQVGHLSGDSLVVVSHLWAILASSGVLVTLCPSPFTLLQEPYLRSAATMNQVEQDTNISDRKVRMRCPTDEQFVFTFPFYTCASYFALSSIAHDAYNEYHDDTEEQLIISGRHDFEINERSWRMYCKQQEGLLIEVTVSKNEPSRPPSRASGLSSDDNSVNSIENEEEQHQTQWQKNHPRGRKDADQPGESIMNPRSRSASNNELEVPPFFLWPLEFRDEVYVIPAEITERYKSSRREATAKSTRAPIDDSITKLKKKDLPAVDSVLTSIDSKLLQALRKGQEQAPRRSRKLKTALFYKASRTRRKLTDIPFEEEFAAFIDSSIKNETSNGNKDFTTWQQVLIELINLIQNAMDAFCPADYSHPVLHTFQNILEHLFLDVKSTCEGVSTKVSSDTTSNTTSENMSNTATKPIEAPFVGPAVVFDQTKMSNIPVKWVNPTFIPSSGCKHCNLDEKGAVTFNSWHQAVEHLRQWHTLGQDDISDEVLAKCVMSQSEFKRLDAAVLVTVAMANVIILMRKLAYAIRSVQYGASDVEGKLKNCLFTMPEELKEAYQSLTSMLVHFGYTVSVIQQAHSLPGDKIKSLDEMTKTHQQKIGKLLAATGIFIDTAKSRLQHMNLPLDHSARKYYNCVSTPYLLATAIGNLSEGFGENDNLQLLYAYEAYIQKISYKVKRHPQRRLRTEIVECQEELTAVLHVFDQQLDVMEQLFIKLDSGGFPNPSKERRFHYEFEREAIDYHEQKLRYRIKTCKGLLSEFERMETELIRALEIESDDQDKAILAFTIVTIIFLPLSFATSFLGMNTTDIRDMGSSQWLFWAIAVPLTFVTVAATVLVAYRADFIRDTISDALHAVANGLVRNKAPREGNQQLEDDNEKDKDEDKESNIVGDRQV